MKTASNIRLSLRKLLIATLALGPLAVLPSPVWATLPTTGSYSVGSGPTSGTFTVTNGAVNVNTSGSVSTLAAQDKSVLVWGYANSTATQVFGSFNVATGETYNFALPSATSSVLNKVGYSPLTSQISTTDEALINGTLTSNGKVFVLANGNITVGASATINTAGLVLSTLQETNDANFISGGTLSLSGAATGNIAINSVGGVNGDLSAYAGNYTLGIAGAHDATATGTGTTVTTGAVTAIALPANVGLWYASAPAVTVVDSNATPGTGATATATLDSMGRITGFTIGGGGGTGYHSGTTTVSIAANPATPTGANLDAVNGGTMATGNLLIKAVNASAGLKLAATALTLSAGNLTVTTNNGTISQGATITDNIPLKNVSISTFSTGTTGTAGIDLTTNGAANGFSQLALTSNGTVTVTNAGGNGTILNASALSSPTALNLITSTNNITTSGAQVVAGSIKYATTGATQNDITIGNNSSVGGNLVLNSATKGNLTFSGVGDLKLGNTTDTIVSTGGTAGGKDALISITTTGAIVTNNNVTTVGNVTLSGTTINQTVGTIGGAGTANRTTFVATAGGATLGAINTKRISVTAANSTISQAAGTVLNTTSTTASDNNTFNAGNGTVTLNNTNTLAFGPSLQVTGASANIINTNLGVNVGTTNVSGNYTLATGTGAVQLGGDDTLNSLAQGVQVGGVLKVTTAGGAISDQNFASVQAAGGIDLTSGAGVITLDAGTNHGALSPLQNYGTINLTTTNANAAISETNTLNFGNVALGTGVLTANSTKGDIIQNGNSVVAATGTFNVSTSNSVTLNGGNNSIGIVNFIGGANNSYTGNAAYTLGSSTNMSSGNLTIASTGSSSDITLGGGTIANLTVNSSNKIIAGTTTIGGALTLNASNTTATAITQTGPLTVVAGVTTVKSAGDAILGTQANDFNAVSLAVTGNATLNDINSLVVSGSTGVDLTATSGNAAGFANPWTLTLGNLGVGGNLSLTAMNGDQTNASAGNSGVISQQSGTSASAFANATFVTNNAAITLNNTGNNFGGVTIATGETATGTINATKGSATVNYAEDNTVRLLNLDNGGNTTLTSRTGSVIETGTYASNNILANVLTVSAPNGSINLGGTTLSGAGALASSITTAIGSAPNGAVNFKSASSNLALGNIIALSVSINHTGGNNLTQSGSLNVYGNSNFTSGGNIILSNTSNNFGRLSLTTTAGKNITVVENGTLNLGKIALGGAGNVTITSQNGDILDSGLLGVDTTSANIVTLNASAGKGNITLTNPTTKLVTTNGVVFNGNNVVLAPLNGSALILGNNSTTSVANGNLTVSVPTAGINNSGNLTVKGNAVFQTGNQDIIVTQAGNQFGQVQFQGKVVQITQSTDMKIMTNSSASQAAQLITSGGNITIVNTGGSNVSFGSTVFMSAGNLITLPKLITAADTLIVSAPGTKDLSALSVSGDLAGKSPINTGSGTYLAPQN